MKRQPKVLVMYRILYIILGVNCIAFGSSLKAIFKILNSHDDVSLGMMAMLVIPNIFAIYVTLRSLLHTQRRFPGYLNVLKQDIHKTIKDIDETLKVIQVDGRYVEYYELIKETVGIVNGDIIQEIKFYYTLRFHLETARLYIHLNNFKLIEKDKVLNLENINIDKAYDKLLNELTSSQSNSNYIRGLNLSKEYLRKFLEM